MRALLIALEFIDDPVTFERYRAEVIATLTPYQGKFLVRGGNAAVVEGDWPFERTVIVEFPSRQNAEAWYASPAYQAILPLRLQSARCTTVIVDAVD